MVVRRLHTGIWFSLKMGLALPAVGPALSPHSSTQARPRKERESRIVLAMPDKPPENIGRQEAIDDLATPDNIGRQFTRTR